MNRNRLALFAVAIGATVRVLASTIDLSTVSQSYLSLKSGDTITGTLGVNCKIQIQAGADIYLKEKKSAVKTTLEVVPPNPAAPAQFFQIRFGE